MNRKEMFTYLLHINPIININIIQFIYKKRIFFFYALNMSSTMDKLLSFVYIWNIFINISLEYFYDKLLFVVVSDLLYYSYHVDLSQNLNNIAAKAKLGP